MYGSRSGNALELLPLIAYLAVSAAAGWALVRAGFNVSAGDRPIVGSALGVVLTTWLANVLGRFVDPPAAFWLAALAVALPAALAYRSRPPRAPERLGTNALLLLVVIVLLAVLFARMGRGLAIFDDRKNLSLISLMAAGGIPPRFYMNPDFAFSYHYAFQLFGAILMRLGGLMPWSAFDLAKGIAAALAVGLAVVWGRRVTGRWPAAAWLGVVLLFGSGARWLLLFFPAPMIQAASRDLITWGATAQSNAGLRALLGSAWGIEGGPPFPVPFAFVNGILQPFILYLQTGPVSMGLIALLLLLILFPARARRWTWAVYVAVLAFAALAAEAGFVLLGMGVVVACAVVALQKDRPDRRRAAIGLLAAVALATVVAVLQGGTMTEVARGVIQGGNSAGGGSGLAGFSLRPSPAIVSSHLGELRLSRPGELLIGLFELGPALLFAPLAIWLGRRAARRGRTLLLAFVISTFIGFVIPFVIRYAVDRDITRLTSYALTGWILLAVVPVSLGWTRGGPVARSAIAVVTVALILPGAVLTGPLMTAMPRAVFSNGFLPADAAMTRLVWNRLAPGSLVIDSDPWRAVVVTGRLTRSAADGTTLLPEWEALRHDPNVGRLVAAGFDYAYVDGKAWASMSPQTQAGYRDACVREVAAVHDDGENGDRWLFDLRECPPG